MCVCVGGGGGGGGRLNIPSALFAAGWLARGCRNPTFITTDYTDPASCPYPRNGRALLEDPSGHGGDDPRTFSLPQFVHLTGAWLVASALLALGLGAAFIHLFKHHSHTMTRVTIISQIAVSQGAGSEGAADAASVPQGL